MARLVKSHVRHILTKLEADRDVAIAFVRMID